MTCQPATAEPKRSIHLSKRMDKLAPSAVREILKVAERPEVISFAGGLPAPELFPVSAIAEATAQVLRDHGASALQYGVTEGYRPLRDWIADRLSRRKVRSSADQVLVTSGSQQGIDLVTRALIDPGARVITENPTYLAALQVFAAAEAEVVAVGGDDQGMRVEELDVLLRQKPARLIYVCPDFQNPRGTTLSLARRERLVEIARRWQVPILEDDAYGELRFSGETPPALAAFDEKWVIRVGTLSKMLAPGLRIGWIHGPLELINRLTILKQAADLHTSTLTQWVAARVLTSFDLEGHLAQLQRIYGQRCTAMLEALARHLPSAASWTRPDGGLFVWLSLPDGLCDETVFRRALALGVAVVPGAGFFVGPPCHSYLRLNYTNQTEDAIQLGVARLAAAMKG